MRLNTAITQLRQSLGFKVSYGLRAFVLYILLLGGLGWFVLNHAIERLNDGMRQAAEHVMVDNVNILAAMLEQHTREHGSLVAAKLSDIMERAKQRVFLAKIYQVDKFSVDAELYITDHNGIVIYDSRYRDTGKDYSQWRDVKLALAGEYGARTSFLDEELNTPATNVKSSATAPKAMIVAAPIRIDDTIVGAVSLLTPINSIERHVATETAQLERTMMIALMVAVIAGFILSVVFSRSINKIAVYANKMARGESVQPPQLLDQRLADLTGSVANLRKQLDGKEYVEQYIHGLTHELKTPITGIRGAVELINEGLPEHDQSRFLANIQSSNERMAKLVDRMLNLAKLESQSVLINSAQFDLNPVVQRLIDERQSMLSQKNLRIDPESATLSTEKNSLITQGDAVLLSQAIANVLDNAIQFADMDSTIKLAIINENGSTCVRMINQGQLIPDYALDKIYQRFFSLPSQTQPHGSSSSQRKSTGLGLRFVKEIMKLHRGSINVDNHANGVIAELRWPITGAA